MLARTKTHHTDETVHIHSVIKKKASWKNFFKKDLETHTERGLYLKGLRLREDYTQKQLGALIGVSQNNISAMEHGHRIIGKDIARRLSHVLKVNYQNFL